MGAGDPACNHRKAAINFSPIDELAACDRLNLMGLALPLTQKTGADLHGCRSSGIVSDTSFTWWPSLQCFQS